MKSLLLLKIPTDGTVPALGVRQRNVAEGMNHGTGHRGALTGVHVFPLTNTSKRRSVNEMNRDNLRILIIDDDYLVRDSLALLFESFGCLPQALDCAEKGEEILRDQAFDVIISDHRLPGMSGLRFLSLAGELSPGTPRILVTGYGDHYLVETARELGIEGYLEKPLSVEDLRRCLRKVLGRDIPGSEPRAPFRGKRESPRPVPEDETSPANGSTEDSSHDRWPLTAGPAPEIKKIMQPNG